MNPIVFTKRYIAKSKTYYKHISGSMLRWMKSVNKLDFTQSQKNFYEESFLCILQ